MNPIKHVPNFITCLNLLCGCLAIVSVGLGDPLTAAYLVIAAAIFDFFDGFAARLLKVSSPIGAELDSLADMVTFGVVPGLMLLHYLTGGIQSLNGVADFFQNPLLLIPLAIPVFSALRLAKFNVDTRQSDSFRGVPTPASALWIISIPLIIAFMPFELSWDLESIITSQGFIIGSSIGLSALMVSDIPLLAMKFKSFGWKGNEARFTFLIISVVLLIILRPVAIPIVLSLYIIISIINNLFLS
ncbi:MAG: CDP-diacylglycerol--serine O-phosphatidyltransferase, partial [Flavobacteriales bacterium]|nr:CDP-diacylglycerol--serine O-phosphatidyltransferase [Flavobacteriales bacterium]